MRRIFLFGHAVLIDKGRDEAVMGVIDQVHSLREIKHGVHHANDGLGIDAVHAVVILNGEVIVELAQPLDEGHHLSLAGQSYMRANMSCIHRNYLLNGRIWVGNVFIRRAYHSMLQSACQ